MNGCLYFLHFFPIHSVRNGDGVSDEEVHGMLFWQMKTMLLVEASGNAKEAALNPFVYKKAKGFVQHFSKEELHSHTTALVELYHEARRGRYELGSALERFILGV